MTARKSFGSDNHAGAHEAVLRMMARANTGDAVAYGDDLWTQRASDELRELFGARGGVFLVFTGGAANVLGLSLLLRPYEGVICPESAHVNVDECGAAERIIGCKLLTVATPDGKLTPDLIATRLGGRGDVHRVQPRAVAISQVTELGTCYTLDELRALAEFCGSEGLRLYADGARLANAAAWLSCSLAEIAALVDVLSFGGTKNGAVGAEAVVVMADDLMPGVSFLRKQQMQLASKMRYLAAQFLGLLEDQLWLRNAAHANLMARRLADGVHGVPGVELRQAVESNAVFASLEPAQIERLQGEWEFHVWDEPTHAVRWMTAFDTTEADVDAFVAAVRTSAPNGSRASFT
ncbi:MAG TPA: low specificity L-threonine aldolase [Streptosporangiaceae bacterium]|nr:low specificity L-threonine aldolase [Streptosporangiaceae bacterium]